MTNKNYSSAHLYASDIDYREAQDPKGAAYDRWLEEEQHIETALGLIEQFVFYHASDKFKTLAASLVTYFVAVDEHDEAIDATVRDALEAIGGDFCRAAERIAGYVSDGDIDIIPVIQHAAESKLTATSIYYPLNVLFWQEIADSELLRTEFDRMVEQDEEDRAVSAWEAANGF